MYDESINSSLKSIIFSLNTCKSLKYVEIYVYINWSMYVNLFI